jgi:hypothetical protein
MVRAFQLLVVVAVTFAAGDSWARACDEGPMSLLPELLRSPAPPSVLAPPTEEPREPRVCTTGATDDPSCRPWAPLLPSGGGFTPLASPAFVAVRLAALPPLAGELVRRERAPRLALAAGHRDRLERPPRSR